MMKCFLSLLVVLALAATAPAQCPGGVCPPGPPMVVQSRPVVIYRPAVSHFPPAYAPQPAPVVRYVQPVPVIRQRVQIQFTPLAAPVCTGPNCRR